MRVLITGSRDWTNHSTIWRALYDAAVDAHNKQEHLIVVHGAAKGADTIAAEFSDGAGVSTEAHPANWKKYGKAAGPIRNKEMLDSGVDLVLAFQKNGSRGTQNMIDLATKAGVPVKTYFDPPRPLKGF